MRKIGPDSFVTMPWKNSGGVTHEIVRRDIGGRLAWRLSLAEVARDGPYSTFPGMERILTVVVGNGTRLLDTESGAELVALPNRPVRFSGEASIAGVLLDGPCRNFNLIYDPALVSADVAFAAGPARTTLPGVGEGDLAVYCLRGRFEKG